MKKLVFKLSSETGLDFRIPILQSTTKAFNCSSSSYDAQVKSLKDSHCRSSSYAGLS